MAETTGCEGVGLYGWGYGCGPPLPPGGPQLWPFSVREGEGEGCHQRAWKDFSEESSFEFGVVGVGAAWVVVYMTMNMAVMGRSFMVVLVGCLLLDSSWVAVWRLVLIRIASKRSQLEVVGVSRILPYCNSRSFGKRREARSKKQEARSKREKRGLSACYTMSSRITPIPQPFGLAPPAPPRIAPIDHPSLHDRHRLAVYCVIHNSIPSTYSSVHAGSGFVSRFSFLISSF